MDVLIDNGGIHVQKITYKLHRFFLVRIDMGTHVLLFINDGKNIALIIVNNCQGDKRDGPEFFQIHLCIIRIIKFQRGHTIFTQYPGIKQGILNHILFEGINTGKNYKSEAVKDSKRSDREDNKREFAFNRKVAESFHWRGLPLFMFLLRWCFNNDQCRSQQHGCRQ